MKVLISGGHLTPALAVIDAFSRLYPDTSIVFIGREFSQEKEGMRSKEREEIERRNIPFYSIHAAKFHRTYFMRNIREFARFLPSLRQVYAICKREQPDIFLSFGGYLAVPIALMCALLRIPIITHEQTKTAGLANSLISRLADRVAISFHETREHFPREKVVFTGNPLRPAFSSRSRKKPEWLGRVPRDLSLVYVTGGSQGSHVINQNLGRILPDLTKKAVVVHQCGTSAHSRYLQELESMAASLSPMLRKRYIVREWIPETEVVWLFQHADLVIARSGANTVHEVMVSKVPALFIPLPFSHNNEQLKNAMVLAQAGSAIVLPQRELNPERLLSTIHTALRRRVRMRQNAQEIGKTAVTDAADRLAYESRKLHARTKTARAAQ